MSDDRPGCLAFVGNVLWVVLAGFGMAVAYVIAGVVMFVTIIGIPFGVQAFKLAAFSFWPFGRAIITEGAPSAASGCMNVLWLVLCGWWLAIGHIVTGVALCLTLIGIPFGIQSFKLAQLSLWPFGMRVVRLDEVPPHASTVVAMRPSAG